jgi:hypothetical protein
MQAMTVMVKVYVRRPQPRRATGDGRRPKTFTIAVDPVVDRKTRKR